MELAAVSVGNLRATQFDNAFVVAWVKPERKELANFQSLQLILLENLPRCRRWIVMESKSTHTRNVCVYRVQLFNVSTTTDAASLICKLASYGQVRKKSLYARKPETRCDERNRKRAQQHRNQLMKR
jgi:hypothetical protein